MARNGMSGKRTSFRGVKDLGAGRYLVRTYARDPVSGRERQKERVVHAASVKEAYEIRCRLESELRQQIDPAAWGSAIGPIESRTGLVVSERGSTPSSLRGRETVGEVAERWLSRRLAEKRKDGRDRLAPATRDRYTQAIEQVIVPMLGKWRLDELERDDVERWRDHLAKSYASATVNGHLNVLRTVLQDVGVDAASRARVLEEDDTRITEDEPNILESDAEVAKFLDVFRESFPQHFPLVAFLVTTGMRIGTALALRRDDFDPDRGLVIARRRLSMNEVVEGVKRGRTARDTVPLVDWVWRAIEAEWAEHSGKQKESALAFPTRIGGHRARSCLNRPFAEVRATLKLGRITPHGPRRTAARMYRKAASSVVSMSVLGHLTEEMHRHYAVVTADEKRKAADEAFGGLSIGETAGSTADAPQDGPRLKRRERRSAITADR